MSRMRSSRRERFFSTLILLFSICAIILVAAIVVDAKLNRAADAPALNTADFVDAGTPAPLVIAAVIACRWRSVSCGSGSSVRLHAEKIIARENGFVNEN